MLGVMAGGVNVGENTGDSIRCTVWSKIID